MAQNNYQEPGVPAKANPFGVFFYCLSFILIIPFIIFIVRVNAYQKTAVKIEEADAGMDIQLQRRRDTLTKLVDITKSSLKFDKDQLDKVLYSRMPQDTEGKIDMLNRMDKLQSKIQATFEAYPQFKSQENVGKLMEAANEIEIDLSASRRIYNSNVSIWNTWLRQFPTNVVAVLKGYKSKGFFQEKNIQDVTIDLNLN